MGLHLGVDFKANSFHWGFITSIIYRALFDTGGVLYLVHEILKHIAGGA